MVDLNLLKQLRSETRVSIAECREALEKTKNDYKKALEWVEKHSMEKAASKSDRKTSQGVIEAYIHQGGRVGALIELACETDFVARTSEFKALAHELAMQVAAMAPLDVEGLIQQEYIRDSSLTIQDLIKQAIGKLGENIVIKKIIRFELGS